MLVGLPSGGGGTLDQGRGLKSGNWKLGKWRNGRGVADAVAPKGIGARGTHYQPQHLDMNMQNWVTDQDVKMGN